VAESYSSPLRVAISAFDLEVPWGGAVRCLEDPLEVDGTSTVYKFGGKDSLEFDRDQVLNHQADVRRILPRGASLKGSLLAVGSQSIPDHFRHGENIPVFVTIYDQYSHSCRSPVSLWADRGEKLLPAAQPKAKRKGLLECLDPPRPLSHWEREMLKLRPGLSTTLHSKRKETSPGMEPARYRFR
jgi:hypothetical protein